MNKTGYDKFFKEAKSAKSNKNVVRKVAPRAQVEAELRRQLKVKTPKNPFPLLPVASGVVLLTLAGLYLTNPDPINNLVSRVQVRTIGTLEAEESPKGSPEKSAEKAPGPPAKSAAAASGEKPDESSTKAPAVAEDLSYIEKLRTRKGELDAREKELNQLEEELQRQKAEVDQRILHLEQMRREIASVLKDRVEADETQLNKLVDLYSTMKPKQAADVIASLQEDLAVQILTKMKKKSAAEVMNLLPADKARGFSEKLTGYKR